MRAFGSKPRWRPKAYATIAAVGCLLAACAEIKPLDYTDIDEIPPRPGLLSGEGGAFLLYSE